MKRVYVVPVAHISKISVKTVEDGINNISPDIVCVELCYNRFQAVMSKKIRILPTLNPFHLLLYYLQRFIGWTVGIRPGEEMRSAILLAHKKKTRVALIDMPIHVIMKGLSNVPLSEWVKAAFTKEKIDIDLSLAFKKGDVMYALSPERLEKLIGKFKKNLPTVYKVMIENRDKYMVKNIEKILKKNDTILCVVGAGHLPGIWKRLKERYKNELIVDILWPK